MRALASIVVSFFCCATLSACGSKAAPADSSVREQGPGRETGAGDGTAGDGGSKTDGTTGKADLPPPPTHWVAVQGSVQPLVEDHAVALLQNGDVIIAGGSRAKTTSSGWEMGIVGDAYRYIASKSVFEAAGKLAVPRSGATATVLKDGRVLVVGGESDAAYGDPTVEIYNPANPASSAWSKAADLPKGRYGHAAVRLPDGRVIVAGGCYYDSTLNTFTIYDPQKNAWSTMAALMKQDRCYHTVTPLASGKLLIAGGFQGPQKTRVWLDSLEIFDPSTGISTLSAAKLAYPRSSHTADSLADGRVLIVGGWCGTCTSGKNQSDLYDPKIDKTDPIADYADDSPHLHADTVMADGRLLIAGGRFSEDRVAAFSTAGGGSWTGLPKLTKPRYAAEAVTLLDGTILVVGGRFDDPGGGIPSHPAAERFVP